MQELDVSLIVFTYRWMIIEANVFSLKSAGNLCTGFMTPLHGNNDYMILLLLFISRSALMTDNGVADTDVNYRKKCLMM